MDDLESIRMSAREFIEFDFEDDRALVSICVDELHRTSGSSECGFDDRDHRRDAASPSEQGDPAISVVEHEGASRGNHHEAHSYFDLIVHPIVEMRPPSTRLMATL